MLFQKIENPFYRKKRSLQLNGKLIQLDEPVVMGILNLTPDSFYEGSRYNMEKEILHRAEEILVSGGLIIDVGAVSTRPGAAEVSEETELARLLPAVKLIRSHFPEAILSVDTFRSGVVRNIYDEIGGFLVNDISGGTMDGEMFSTVANLGLPYILMHMQGTPQTMQIHPFYVDVVKDILFDLSEKLNSLKLLGVNDIIVDPGFGFGKNQRHNYELLNCLDSFRLFELPLLVGVSRKAMIWKLLDSSPAESLNGTTVLNTLALMGGADILRVHDVREAVETIKLVAELKK
ncbi:MAG: dihydropteroate synthase [Prolixibacteraceae bacterium]|nr:dihydropteroate synthase [Prolixibacteraceae bacterium]